MFDIRGKKIFLPSSVYDATLIKSFVIQHSGKSGGEETFIGIKGNMLPEPGIKKKACVWSDFSWMALAHSSPSALFWGMRLIKLVAAADI